MLPYTEILPAAFYHRDPVLVAQELLGKILVRELQGNILAARIVETEAYLAANDPASHAFSGRTTRNAAMFGPPGRAYVYLIYGRHYCVNAVTEGEGVPSAVLIRALEPLLGMAHMAARRGTGRLTALANGPGKLCQAFGIDRRLDHWDLTQGTRLWCAMPASPLQLAVTVTPRIGITVASDLLLRFCIAASPYAGRSPRCRT
jgi:DNA-3-methyladenine glycosylase